MIQAIVFLPLIGAILAGLIAIWGAHARNPSGGTGEHQGERKSEHERTEMHRGGTIAVFARGRI